MACKGDLEEKAGRSLLKQKKKDWSTVPRITGEQDGNLQLLRVLLRPRDMSPL
jgi:hypothetical protein